MRSRALTTITLLGIALCASLSGGCAVDRSAFPVLESYVNATAAPFSEYVKEDFGLSPEQKARRLQAVESAQRYVAGAKNNRASSVLAGVKQIPARGQ